MVCSSNPEFFKDNVCSKFNKTRATLVSDDVFEYDEIDDEKDGSVKVIKRKVDFTFKYDNQNRLIKTPIINDEYEYDEIIDENTGEKKLIKRKVEYEFVEVELENGKKHIVRRPKRPDIFEMYEVEERTGDIQFVKKPIEFKIVFEKDSKTGELRKIRRKIEKDDFEYDEVDDEDNLNNMKIVRNKVNYSVVNISPDMPRVYRRNHLPIDYEFVEVPTSNGETKVVKRLKNFQTVELNHNGKPRKVRKPPAHRVQSFARGSSLPSDEHRAEPAGFRSEYGSGCGDSLGVPRCYRKNLSGFAPKFATVLVRGGRHSVLTRIVSERLGNSP